MPLRLLLWLYMRGSFRCWLNCSFESARFWTGRHYYFLSWQPLSPWWILSNGLFSSVHVHPHVSVFFLLFLQLLHGALVREHWGDGCKYLIVGDFLAAGWVPHLREVLRTQTQVHQCFSQTSCFHKDSQRVIYAFYAICCLRILQ